MDPTHIAVNGIRLHVATAGPARAPWVGGGQDAALGGALLCDLLAQPATAGAAA